MHAVVQALEVACQREQPPQRRIARRHERVEQAYFHVQLRGQPEQQTVHVDRVQVIHQHPHPHAACGGVAQRAQDRPAGRIVSDQVGLQVERARGGRDHRQPCVECEVGLRNRPHAARAVGHAGVARNRDECRARRAGQRGRRPALDLRQHAGARRQQGGERRSDQPAPDAHRFSAAADRRCRSAASAARSRALSPRRAPRPRPRL